MEHIIDNPNRIASLTATETEAKVSGPAYEAYQILRRVRRSADSGGIG